MLYLGIGLGAVTALWLIWNLTLDALWQPTDRVTARRILVLAETKEGECVFDLGCGDGRIVVAAARDFGARAVGYEVDPFRALWGKTWIRLARLEDRARVVMGDMCRADLAEADVVVLFLSAKANARLEAKLRRELKPGARVVSYFHPMAGWRPREIGLSLGNHPLYLYRMEDVR